MGKVRKGRSVDAALCKKGFRCEEDSGHFFYALPGSSVRTKISHGMMGRDIGRELLGVMAKQLRLSFAQFLDLIDCPLDEAGYRAILRNSGFIL